MRRTKTEAEKHDDRDARMVHRLLNFDTDTERPSARYQVDGRNFRRWIAPGIWQDARSEVHFNLDWMLYAMELSDNAENIKGAENTMAAMLAAQEPELAKRFRYLDR